MKQWVKKKIKIELEKDQMESKERFFKEGLGKYERNPKFEMIKRMKEKIIEKVKINVNNMMFQNYHCSLLLQL